MKYLELHWRKAWHEPVSLCRQLGGGPVLLESHLMAGLGQYHHLLLGLADQYGLPAGYTTDFINTTDFGFTGGRERRGAGDQWVLDVVARCLVWLGDLARYRLELLEGPERTRTETLARKYYSLSTRVKPGLGLSYNQLAALAGDNNHGIDQLFFYLKCVVSRERFEGGDSNLRRMLDKFESEALVSPAEKSSAEVSSLQLINLVSCVIQEKNEDDVILACQQSLSALHQTLSAGPVCGEWLLRAVCCLVFLVARLGGNTGARPGGNNAGGSAMAGLCQAWLIALTSHLAGLMVTGLGRGLYGSDWTEESISVDDSVETEEAEEVVSAERKKRKKLTDLLRRRRVSNSGSSVESDLSEDEIERSLSEDEFDSEDEEDDIYFSDSEDSDSDVVVEDLEPELPTTLDLVHTCSALGLLPALNLCLLWLRAQPEVLTGIGDGGAPLWTKLARLFTLLNLSSARYTKDAAVSRMAARNRLTAVEEEFYLRDMELFTAQLEGLDWSREPVGAGAGHTVARLVRLKSWREWLVGREECSIRWREGEGRAVLVKSALPEKKNVMKHMAELWLKEEVSNLERNQGDHCTLVVDAAALTTDLQMVKRVAGYRSFTVIVPQVVIRELDNIKKHVRYREN